MNINQRLEKTGNWLFQRRGYFPLLILIILLPALQDSEYIERHSGDFAQTLWEVFCIIISFLGLAVRALTVGWVREDTSGRNTKSQLAGSLNTDGLYALTRHPLYAGNFLIVFGFALFVQVWWFVIIYALSFTLFYEHIIFAEESFLERKFGAVYREWAEQTPIFFPNFKKWKKPENRFSWKMVLKREYSTLFGIIAGFVFIKFFAELIAEHQFKIRMSWIVFLGIGFAFYTVLRTIRKKTNWLHTGR